MAQQSTGGRRNPIRPKRLPSIPTFPRGPEYLDFTSVPKIGGHGEPPPGFISPSNSHVEWQVYFSLSKVFGVPKDPRTGPFIGYPGTWDYQVPFRQQRTPGSTAIDFVVYPHPATRGQAYALRIVTEFFHLLTDPRKRAKDTIQEAALSSKYIVRDLYERSFIYDKTSQSCIKLLKHILAGGASPDPFQGGQEDLRIRDRG